MADIFPAGKIFLNFICGKSRIPAKSLMAIDGHCGPETITRGLEIPKRVKGPCPKSIHLKVEAKGRALPFMVSTFTIKGRFFYLLKNFSTFFSKVGNFSTFPLYLSTF